MAPFRKILPKPAWYTSTAGAAGIASTDSNEDRPLRSRPNNNNSRPPPHLRPSPYLSESPGSQTDLGELTQTLPLMPKSNTQGPTSHYSYMPQDSPRTNNDGQAGPAAGSNSPRMDVEADLPQQRARPNRDSTQAEYEAIVVKRLETGIAEAFKHQTPSPPSTPPKNPFVIVEEQEQDPDAITPAPPRAQNLPVFRQNDRLIVDPNRTLTIAHPIPGVQTNDRFFAFNMHPHIPKGLKVRFLKSGSPLTNDLVYASPLSFYEDRVRQITHDLSKYAQRHAAGRGHFGSLAAWDSWADHQHALNEEGGADGGADGDLPRCANCVDLAYRGAEEEAVYVPACNWLIGEGARACDACAALDSECVVGIAGLPTLLREPSDRLFGGVDVVGIARE